MPAQKPVVVVSRKLPEVVETRLMELFDTRLNRDDKPMSPAELKAAMKLADAFVPLMDRGGAIVGLDFDAAVAWPAYNWMGVAKSALESINRYLAKELGPRGIRSNLVAAGPIKTMAAKSIPGFKKFEDVWDERAPLGWDVTNGEPVARAVVALLSDWFPATTGSMIHVDGGYHATGA